MSLSLGYFISRNSELIEQMQESWGGRFEALNLSEKLCLLGYVVGSITSAPSDFYEPENIDECVIWAGERMQELSFQQRLDLAKGIIYLAEHHITSHRLYPS